MFEIQNHASFIAAILLFQLAPGPGTLAILNATGRGGIGAGMGAVLGTLSGDFVYMAAAVLGLAAVLEAYPSVLSTIQWAGVSYLWKSWDPSSPIRILSDSWRKSSLKSENTSSSSTNGKGPWRCSKRTVRKV